MTTYSITGPDGKTYSIDGPEGATRDQVIAKIKERQSAPKPVGVSDLAREFAEGVPIIGGLLNKANAATYAAAAPLAPSDTTVSHAGTLRERYEENLKRENERDAAFEEQHPIASTAAGVAGGVASALPLAATEVGATALGLGGKTLGSQILRGAASGAAINAADAAVRGGDPLTAGAIGGATGGLAEPVSRLAGAAIEPVANTVRGIINPEREASRRVAGAAERDLKAGTTGLTPKEWTDAKRAGQPVTLMEQGGETTRALARSAANTSPEGRAVLDKTINDRFETQSDRLTDWLRSTFHFPNVAAQQEALEETAQRSNTAAYGKAMREGSEGLWSPELERLAGSDAVTSAMQNAAKSAKDESIVSGHGAMNPKIVFTPDGRMKFTRGNGVPTYPDLEFWDLTRRELSDAATAAYKSGRNTEGRRLTVLSQKMNAELDRLVPSYQEARAGAARFFGAENALEAGQKFVTSRMGNNEARQALAKMSPIERRLFQDGFVDTFVQQVRESGDRRSIMNTVANSPAGRERLAIALGRDKANELEAMLRVEGVMDLARGAVQGNSTTARQLVELGLAGGAYTYGTGGNVTNPDPQAIMNAALVYGAAKGHHVIDTRVAEQVARQLTSQNPKFIVQGLQTIAKNAGLLNALRAGDAALARAGSVQVSAPSPLQSPLSTGAASPLASGGQ